MRQKSLSWRAAAQLWRKSGGGARAHLSLMLRFAIWRSFCPAAFPMTANARHVRRRARKRGWARWMDGASNSHVASCECRTPCELGLRPQRSPSSSCPARRRSAPLHFFQGLCVPRRSRAPLPALPERGLSHSACCAVAALVTERSSCPTKRTNWSPPSMTMIPVRVLPLNARFIFRRLSHPLALPAPV